MCVSEEKTRKERTAYTENYKTNRDIDKVDATMDDIRDQMDVANEISEAISRPVGMGDELDEVKCCNSLALCCTKKIH